MARIRLNDYDYSLPPSAVALRPAKPRDSAKLLVYDRRQKTMAVDTFRHLGGHLKPSSVLVFNDTRVIPARFIVTKPTGGRATLLYLGHHGKTLTVLADRRLEVGWKLSGPGSLSLRVVKHNRSHYVLRPSSTVTAFLRQLEKTGLVPLPPYLRHSSLSESERRTWYQTVFARRTGSVAAPTASLHFTKTLLTKLRRQGIAIEYVTLHVNLGTFAPVSGSQLRAKKLHTETYEISGAAAARLTKYKKTGRPIIAVGTTVARTLESAARRGRLVSGRRETNIFIRPGYRWKFVDGLITNFHVPQSSLLMLVAALVGRPQLLRLYQQALKRKFKFFSFGDGMLIR